MGGVAQVGGDITSGLPRVEELFEGRSPKTPAIISDLEGIVKVEEHGEETIIHLTSKEPVKQEFNIPSQYTIQVQDSDQVQAKDVLAVSAEGRSMRTPLSGKISIKEGLITVTARDIQEIDYTVPSIIGLKVEDGQEVTKGQPLTEGHIDLQQLLILGGRHQIERYIVNEVQKIYSSQGQSINNKHIEIIVRQMLSKMQVTETGKSSYITGQTIDHTDLLQADKEKLLLQADQLLLGITRVSLRTKSFLSAASFQETTSVLIDAAVQSKRDELRGLKENVIIGKLIPAGTGFNV